MEVSKDVFDARVKKAMESKFVKQLSAELAPLGYILDECYATEDGWLGLEFKVSLRGINEYYPTIKASGIIYNCDTGLQHFGLVPVESANGDGDATIWKSEYRDALIMAVNAVNLLESKDWRLCPILDNNLNYHYINLVRATGDRGDTTWRVLASSAEDAREKLEEFIKSDVGYKEFEKAFDRGFPYKTYRINELCYKELGGCKELTSESLKKEYQDYMLYVTSYTYHKLHWDNNSRTSYCDKYGLDYKGYDWELREYK